ncbi:hypothetical protein H6G89_14265 [Oscillatoria sp. FACHB-1407]|uniref:hypothetical protein n=1 Tax=Oscillatoria sp. FACHB-1407 TaxID=2692847 RepID=UPI0016899BF5|nr:hypothetical protein [Oscillatoria sp. FACHB-1407]MBD2462208.1 hypothetical protein [Oscillatoria sp. FACHB-1407]
MNRPTGVTILAVLQAILSSITLIIGVGVLVFKDQFLQMLVETPEFQQSGETIPPEVLSGIATFTGIIVIISGLIGLLLAYGLFKLYGWAWIVTLVFQILGILSNLFGLFTAPANAGWTVIQLVISGVIVYYLLRPQVKRAFGQ